MGFKNCRGTVLRAETGAVLPEFFEVPCISGTARTVGPS
jgi:hypothetical protein